MKDVDWILALAFVGITTLIIVKVTELIRHYSLKKLEANKEINERRRATEQARRDFQEQMETRTSKWQRDVQQDKAKIEKAWKDYQEQKEIQRTEWEKKVREERALQSQIENDISEREQRLREDKEAIEILVQQKSTGFPWLSAAIAEYIQLQDMKIADQLKEKKHPALKSANTVREIASSRRKAEQAWRLLNYQMHYYETLFPWLEEYKEEGLDEQIKQILGSNQLSDQEEEEDPVSKFMTGSEFQSLSSKDRNQLALDRYWTKPKSSWELGRDYERFVGYLLSPCNFRPRL